MNEPPLVDTGDARINPFFSMSLFLVYVWSPRGAKKSPDASFTPRDATSPPLKIKPNTLTLGPGVLYPTVVYEVSHMNESLRRMKDDARTKAFSILTSIQVVICVKISKGHFQAFWGKRHPTRPGGMLIQQRTDKLDVHQPTQIMFTIPATLVFHGVAVLPPTPTPNLQLKLERVRNAIARFM